jgi:hypothetical protein
MSDSIALKRYLSRHIEPGLPAAPGPRGRWQQVLVIPAYDESPQLSERLQSLRAPQQLLVILVLNRPQSCPLSDANRSLRRALELLPQHLQVLPHGYRLAALNSGTDLLVCDLDLLQTRISDAFGVGLARKIGCDLALKWLAEGSIESEWICSSDADAQLPTDYFQTLKNCTRDAPAAVFPFVHQPGPDDLCNRATLLYELRLHHYVLGLEYAHSPYAYHTMGSCLAVRPEAYAQVRGFPKRAAAEDFYLLGKLAKLGDIARMQGSTVNLESRFSHRVPFGTGPATEKISAAKDPELEPLFYHPLCFEALKAVLDAIPELQDMQDSKLPVLLRERGLPEDLVIASCRVLHEQRLGKALTHCRRQGKQPQQYLRHFNQWFDGFRTLKFIHGIRGAGWEDLCFQSLQDAEPVIWPYDRTTQYSPSGLRQSAFNHWHWTPSL